MSNKNNFCKCRYCGKEIEKTTAYSPKKSMYYCSENHYLSQLEKMKTNNVKHSYKSAEGTDRRDYSDYIQNLYIRYGWNKNKINWQIIFSQTNTLLKNNPNWSYETIKYILWYEEEIMGIQLITKESNWSPLSLVDYHALDAQLYWEECQNVIESVDNFDFNEEIKIIKNTENKKTKRRMINMEDL